MKQQEQSKNHVYQVWRLDDNGNEFLVREFDDLKSAEVRVSELASIGHKQVYWIKEADI
jgi:hypothetical protein